MKKIILIMCSFVFVLSGCDLDTFMEEQVNSALSGIEENLELSQSGASSDDYSKNKLIKIDDCDLSGVRQDNVKVDVGVGERVYYAYTNDYGQLVYIEADEVILQDDDNEDVNKNGRYCNDEAKVPGVEDKNLDEGHGIADSLGGASNAYNITPQNSILNRSGDQSDFEEDIRSALENGKKVENFKYTITYDDTQTMIPSGYVVSYEVGVELFEDSFLNK